MQILLGFESFNEQRERAERTERIFFFTLTIKRLKLKIISHFVVWFDDDDDDDELFLWYG